MLDKSFFSGSLNGVKNQHSADNEFYNIIPPTKLRELIKCPHENPEDWNFWREIVVDRSEGDETKRAELQNEVWPVVHNIIWNKELLLWAQRSYMKERFANYDKADAAMWEDHNRPWDYDHLLPAKNFSNLKSGVRYMRTCQNRGNTIGNLHILPLEENRQRQDEPANKTFENRTPKELTLIHLSDKDDLDAFSINKDDVHNGRKIRPFAEAVHRRIYRIYEDWFESLDIAFLINEHRKIDETSTGSRVGL